MPVLFPIAWGFVGAQLPVYVKYVVVSTLALVACFLLSKFVLLKVPGFSTVKKS